MEKNLMNNPSLEQLHEQLLTILDSLDAAVYVADIETLELLFINKYIRDIFGDIKGMVCWQTLQSNQTGPCDFCTNDKLLTPDGNPAGLHVWEFQNTLNGKWYQIHDRAIKWVDGSIVRLEIATDITEKKNYEEELKASLKEKEILLREIHHRVKNNMTVVSSLLMLQSSKVENDHDKEMFYESKNRIKAMALIHDKLYHGENLAKISFDDYINDITDSIFMTYNISSERIRLKKDVDAVTLDINTAIPCGLIVNELLSNSIKHAFPDDRDGEINVALKLKDGHTVELTVSDNGIGFPEGLDFRNTETLGMNLVDALAGQLMGKIELSREHSTEFKVTFSLNT
jgi:two-component sensor histidine kinase